MSKIKELKSKRRNSISSKLKIQLTLEIAILHTENSNFQEAFEEYGILLELSKEENDLYMMANASRQMGECLLELQKPSEALEHIKYYLKIAQDMYDIFEIQRASVTMGRCYLDIVTSARNPHSKQAAAVKSENAFVKSLQTCQKISENPNCEQLYQKNTKLSSTKSSNLKLELAEMRTVSLFNIGLVNREKGDRESLVKAERYFSQCAEFAIKERLWDMFLRSSFQRADTKYADALKDFRAHGTDVLRASRLSEEAINIIRSTLNQLVEVPFTSAMKKLRRDIWELQAQCMVLVGQTYKAAKKFRNMKKLCPAHRADYERKMICSSALHKKLDGFQPVSADCGELIYVGRLYDELAIPIMSTKYLELALQRCGTRDKECRLKLVNKLVALNTVTGNYADNIPLLERKLRDQMKSTADSETVAMVCCSIIEQLLECWLRSGAAHEQPERVIQFTEQLDNLATVSNRSSIQINATRTTVQFYEDLANPALKANLLRAKEKLHRLEAIEERDGYAESETDDIIEPELSDIEFAHGEIDEHISSDSDVDIRTLSEGQIEELEAVGKRIKSSANSSFVKRNEKGETLLHVAAIAGKLRQVVKLVDQMGHPIDEVDSAGWTALHDAANHGHTAIVKFLVDRGANIEHVGPAIDSSTPLMEAVHGGNLDTATVLIECGANLWHKNRASENLGDCIDAWRQRCKREQIYKESQARSYRDIMLLIKSRLGSRYIEWCRARKGQPIGRENKPPGVVEESVATARETPVNKSILVDRRRVMDTEEEHSSDTENEDERTASTSSRHVRDYLATMRGLQLGQKRSQDGAPDEEPPSSRGSEAGFVIGDDWLEDDTRPCSASARLIAGTKRKSRAISVSSKNCDDVDQWPCRRPRLVMEDAPMATETQGGGNKSLVSDTNTPGSIADSTNEFQNIDDDDDEIFGTLDLSDLPGTVDDTATGNPASSLVSGVQNTDVTTVSVGFRAVTMVIPIPKGTTVNWLIEETARRYVVLVPDQSVPLIGRMRVTTEDGSLLLPCDGLWEVLPPMSVIGAPNKLLVTEVELVSGMPSRLAHVHKTAMPGIEERHQLDIKDCNLHRDLQQYLGLLHHAYNVRGLTSISLAGNGINDDILTKPFSMDTRNGDHHVLDMSRFFGQHSSTLEQLDLSSNSISGVAMSNFLLSLKSRGLNRLKLLDLSDNPIGNNDFCVVSLVLKPILAIAPLLETLRLGGCEISNFSEFSRSIRSNGSQEDRSPSLRELDLSRNSALVIRMAQFESGHFWHAVGPSLRHLTLSGCGESVIGYDGHNNRALINDSISTLVEAILNGKLSLTSLDISACSLDTECVYTISKLLRSRNSSMSCLTCHGNSVLRECTEAWCSLVHDLSQLACRVTMLSIDLPSMRSLDEYEQCLHTLLQKVRVSRVGTRLRALRLCCGPHLAGPVRHALLEHDQHARLAEDAVKTLPGNGDDDNNEDLLQEHYSCCFVVSVLDAFRECSGDDNVPVGFEDDFVCLGVLSNDL